MEQIVESLFSYCLNPLLPDNRSTKSWKTNRKTAVRLRIFLCPTSWKRIRYSVSQNYLWTWILKQMVRDSYFDLLSQENYELGSWYKLTWYMTHITFCIVFGSGGVENSGLFLVSVLYQLLRSDHLKRLALSHKT